MAERFTAAQADLEFRAETGTARANVEELRRDFRQATAGMSADTLKLTVAQEKLDKALIRHGPASTQAKQAELAYRREVASTTTHVTRQTSAIDREERSLGRLSRGALAGSGALHGLGRSVAFASASFLGGAGLVFAIRQTITEAEHAQVVQAQLGQAVRNSGLDYERYRRQINDTLQAQSKLSAFDDEELAQSFAKLIVRTKDVNEALRLNGISADVARGRNISLEAASQLVLKASIGQAGALRRLGIDAAKGASSVELIALVEQKYAGQAGKFAETAAGKQAYFNKQLRDSQEIIGGALLPVISDLAERMAAYLEKLNSTGELQRDVNKVVKTGGKVAHDLEVGFLGVNRVLSPLVHSLGGVEQAAKLALESFAVAKLRSIALAIRGIGTASLFSAGGVNALAAAEGRAAAAGGAAGIGGGAAGVGLGATGLLYGAAGTAVYGVGGAGIGVEQRNPQKLVKKNGRFYLDYGNGTLIELTQGQAAAFLKSHPDRSVSPGLANRPEEGTRGPSPVSPATKKPAARKPGDGLTPLQKLLLADQEPGNDLADARALLAYYQRYASNAKLTGDKLFQAKQDVLTQEAKVQAILDQRAADAKAAADKRQAAVEKQQAAAKRAQQKLVDAVRRADLSAGPYATIGTDFNPAGKSPAEVAAAAAKKAKAADEPATKADIAGSVREALQQMIQINQRYAPNFQIDTGRLETHGFETVSETRRQTEILRGIAERGGFPASAYAQTSAWTAGA